MHMAQTLGSFDLGVPEVEEEDRAQQVLVMVEDEQNNKKGVLPDKFHEDLSNFVMEEDPDMYAAAGILFQAMSTRPNNQVNIQQTIEAAISSVPARPERR
jgi:hypothetical protein